jgi:PGF-pre-PGF domain-containing protein
VKRLDSFDFTHDGGFLSILAISIVLISGIIIFPASADNFSIIRDVSETHAIAGNEIEVVLSFSGMEAGGIVETIPQGWSFAGTDYPDDQYLVDGENITFSVLRDSEIVYCVNAGQKGGTFSGIWEDVLNRTKGTIPDTLVYVGGSDNGGSNDGGDDDHTDLAMMSQESGASTTSTSLFFSLNASDSRSFTRSDRTVTGISLSGNGTLADVNISVVQANPPSSIPTPAGIVYTYLDITCSGADRENVTGAEVNFGVPSSWMDNNRIDPSSVVLMRYNTSWTSLPTDQCGMNGSVCTYTADTPGFSTFVITGKAPVEEATPSVTISRETESKVSVTVATPDNQPRPGLNTEMPNETASGNGSILVVLIAGVVCGIGGYLRHTPRENHDEKNKE